MLRPGRHAVLPVLDHDAGARSDFVFALRQEAIRETRIDARTVYESRVRPTFERERGRPPKDRHEVRRALLRDGFGQVSSALRLLAQEMMWDTFGDATERQLPALAAAADRLARRARGTLRLDPSVAMPRYVTAVDIHGMPGNYQGELGSGDLFAGAVYDQGAFVRAVGSLGPYTEEFGRTAIRYLKGALSREPKRILDLGCAVGHSTLPYCEAFPDAEIHAIDVAAPMLRYAHARAEARGMVVHFSQQDAEHTSFPDGYFDVIVSHATLHETATGAMQNIFNECFRLLAPGGITLHGDGPPWDRLPLFDAAVHDWDTHFNAEPFISKMHDLDQKAMLLAAGFSESDYIDVWVESHYTGTSGSTRGKAWFFGARK
ncbi:MAG: class I SAM-dependent methyltransferase [Alphaproteobacteria bacterium]|nr:class I SAM-dependent methyltransferase [Alphaproteobacteria bacterium]